MGLFGSKPKVETKVTPDKRVSDILQKVADETNSMNDYGFTPQQLAGLNETQRGALAQLARSPAANHEASMYNGRTAQGLGDISRAEQMLQDIRNNPVTAKDAVQYAQALHGKNSLSSRALQQGTEASGAVARLGGDAALRSRARFNTQNINALAHNQLIQQGQSQGINEALGNQGFQSGVAQQFANQGNTNLRLGGYGVDAAQQAIQNRLSAGNIMQRQQQLQNQVDWQNAMGAQQYDWNQINNKLNVLNEISPMAGYKTEGVGPGISKGQQLLGMGIQGLGMLGKFGMLGNSASMLQNNLNNGTTSWGNLMQGAKQTDSIGGIPVYSGGGGAWGGSGNQMLGALSSFAGGTQ